MSVVNSIQKLDEGPYIIGCQKNQGDWRSTKIAGMANDGIR